MYRTRDSTCFLRTRKKYIIRKKRTATTTSEKSFQEFFFFSRSNFELFGFLSLNFRPNRISSSFMALFTTDWKCFDSIYITLLNLSIDGEHAITFRCCLIECPTLTEKESQTYPRSQHQQHSERRRRKKC